MLSSLNLHLSNLSEYFAVLTDFVARLSAVRLLSEWDIPPGQARALNHRISIQKFGHLASLLWARLILGRFRDAASRQPLDTTTGAGKGAYNEDLIALLYICGGAYRGRNVQRSGRLNFMRPIFDWQAPAIYF